MSDELRRGLFARFNRMGLMRLRKNREPIMQRLRMLISPIPCLLDSIRKNAEGVARSVNIGSIRTGAQVNRISIIP